MPDRTETNQASEDDLRPFTSLFQNAAVARDYVVGSVSDEGINELAAHIFFIDPQYKYDISKLPIDNVFSAYRIAVGKLIRTEKLKLLAEVRERVVGENQHSEHKEWDCPCGATHSFTEEWHATNRLRDEQRAALTKLEAEL